MLAAQAAWLILESEHTHMRRLLASMFSVLEGKDWPSPAGAARLKQLIAELEVFDHDAHRPKGAGMLESMWGRSTAADGQLRRLTDERARTDALLLRAREQCEAIASGATRVPSRDMALWVIYRDSLLAQMELEETILRAHAERLLSEEEWSRIVSQVSTQMMLPDTARQRRDEG